MGPLQKLEMVNRASVSAGPMLARVLRNRRVFLLRKATLQKLDS